MSDNSNTGERHGVSLDIDLQNVSHAEIFINPTLKDIESIFLAGYWFENCNSPVVKALFRLPSLQTHRVFRGVPIVNLDTGVPVGIPNGGGATWLTKQTDTYGSSATVYPSQAEPSLFLFPGTNQSGSLGEFRDLQTHLPVIHGMKSHLLNKMEIHIMPPTQLEAAVTFDRCVLHFVCYPAAGPSSQEIFRRTSSSQVGSKF